MNLNKNLLKKLNISEIYNKTYAEAIYQILCEEDCKVNNKYYDPIIEKDVEVNKKNIYLSCWRLYFKELAPIFSNKKENFELIHTIYGNEIFDNIRFIYNNALFFRVTILNLQEKLKEYKKDLKKLRKEL